MALRKASPTTFGVDGEYWRIAQTNIDWTTMKVHVEVLQYVDEKARREFRSPTGSICVDIDLTGLVNMKMPIESIMDVGSIVYTVLKSSHPFFVDAEDIIDAGQTKVEVDLSPAG